MRIGIIGHGFIAKNLIKKLLSPESSARLVFVHARSPASLEDLPKALRLLQLDDFSRFQPDLIIEAAHACYSASHGEKFLQTCDFMPVSTSALADEGLYQRLTDAATSAGTRLLIPHGALPGLDDLLQGKGQWCKVHITFRKPPGFIDFSSSGINPASINKACVLYDGPVGGIARLFPRNVNTMITCALVTNGPDHCQATLIADPQLEHLEAEIFAETDTGDSLHIVKRHRGAGVSGADMIASILRSVERACEVRRPVQFV